MYKCVWLLIQRNGFFNEIGEVQILDFLNVINVIFVVYYVSLRIWLSSGNVMG